MSKKSKEQITKERIENGVKVSSREVKNSFREKKIDLSEKKIDLSEKKIFTSSIDEK